MADKRNHDHEIFDAEHEHSEFQFADEDETPVYAEEARPVTTKPGAGSLWQKLRKNKIFLVIGVLVVIYCVYQVIGLFAGPSDQSKKQLASATGPKPAVTTMAPLPMQQPAQAVPQSTPNLDTTVTNVQQSQQAESTRLAALEQQSANFARALTAMQQQAANNASQIQAIQLQLNNIDRSLMLLAQQLKPKTAVKKPAAKAKTAVPVLYVKAIIPGRAWLENSNGATITVSPGDTIPNYGRVTDIDPDSGTVGTTSGKTIHFGINEH